MVRHTVAWVLPILLVFVFTLSVHAGGSPQATTAPAQGRVVRNSNLRAGPSTNFAIVGFAEPGELIAILGCNSDCTWYQLAPDCWIAAFLVVPVTTVTTPAAATDASGVAISITVSVTGATAGANVIVNPTRCPQTARPVTTYAGPGAQYGIVDTRPQGECVAVVGRDQSGTWFQLSHGMWMLAADVRYAEPLRTIPVTDLTPTPTETPLPIETPTQVPTVTPSYQGIPGGTTSQNCDPNYEGACVPPFPPDVDCGSLPHNFSRIGDDPHGLDNDNDGIACEE